MSLMKFSSSVPVRALDKRQILPSLEWPDVIRGQHRLQTSPESRGVAPAATFHFTPSLILWGGKKRKTPDLYLQNAPPWFLPDNKSFNQGRAGWDLFQWSSSHDFITGYTIFIHTLTFRHNKGLQPAATTFELWAETPKSKGRTYCINSIKTPLNVQY